MYIVHKIFHNETIRTAWSDTEEKYYISVVDIVGILSESDNPRNYWKVLKHRLVKEGNETVTNCNQLKLKAQDGKYRLLMLLMLKECFELSNRYLVKTLNLSSSGWLN